MGKPNEEELLEIYAEVSKAMDQVTSTVTKGLEDKCRAVDPDGDTFAATIAYFLGRMTGAFWSVVRSRRNQEKADHWLTGMLSVAQNTIKEEEPDGGWKGDLVIQLIRKED